MRKKRENLKNKNDFFPIIIIIFEKKSNFNCWVILVYIYIAYSYKSVLNSITKKIGKK